MKFIKHFKKIMMTFPLLDLLVQLTPSPSNPLSQVHSKLPIVSVQLAFTLQLAISDLHSSMSIEQAPNA